MYISIDSYLPSTCYEVSPVQENAVPGLVVGQHEMLISAEGQSALTEIENRPSRINYAIFGIGESSSTE